MSMVERTRVECDAIKCGRRTYVATRSDNEAVLRSHLNRKGWAFVEVGKLRRALCPEHVAIAEATFAVDFVNRPASTSGGAAAVSSTNYPLTSDLFSAVATGGLI